MRILLACVSASEEDSERGQFVKTVLVPLWRRNFDLVKQEDTKLTFRFPRWGLTGFDGFFYSYLHNLNAKSVFHAIVQAEKEGFDAAMISCFLDPMLWDVRQAVDIPVFGIGESSMLLATMMGYKFGVVTVSPYTVHDQKQAIAKYGLKERSAGVRVIPESSEDQTMALVDARHTIDSFKNAARELIADGAEVIIPGCGLMSPALRLAPGAEKEYPNGLTEVDGVPVADVLGNTIKMAELMVTLKRAGSCWISRKGLYAQATPRAREFGQMVLKDDGPGFWDC